MDSRKQVTASARGDQPFDLAILNVQLINVLTGEIYPADIGIRGDRISYVGQAGEFILQSNQVINGAGMWASPGFIDGHVHNESSMCTPAHWAAVILPHGTTTVCTDPHEIGNVMGMRGVKYMLDASQDLPLRYYITVPSCVPAVPQLESAGATFTDRDVTEMLQWERVVAIAEAMDFVGLINQAGKIVPIVEAGHQAGLPIEGHAPGVNGRFLQAYLTATGPRATDHESLTGENMVEKVRNGAMVYARLSSFSNVTNELARAICSLPDARMFGFCTDDIMPNLLVEFGHLDHGMRSLIAAGVQPVKVYQMATFNVAQHYGFWGLGAIAPGWFADIVLLDDLEQVHVSQVITAGKVIAKNGQLIRPLSEPIPPIMENTVRLPENLSVESFFPKCSDRDLIKFNAINLSNLHDTRLEVVKLPCKEGQVSFPLPAGVAMAAVVGRHGQGRPPSLAFVTGYPIQAGAIASTISHDSHNLVIIGKTPCDMYAAARALVESGGGLVAIKDGEILNRIPLPVAGLISPLPVHELSRQVIQFIQVLPKLGLPEFFPVTLLDISLPVIPNIRLTDLGLVDIITQQFLPLEA
ncbi:MAG: amidohydrolase family protein [Chloroflexi bacterium]|nr:amidohydrolase family protein [Chloroflexota bacterium]